MKSESVAETVQYAGWWRRIGAVFYEALLMLAVVMVAEAVLQGLLQLALGLPATAISAHLGLQIANGVYLVVVGFAYLGWCWGKIGQTLAMKTWRFKLTAANGVDCAGLRALLLRYLLCMLFYLPLLPLAVLAHYRPELRWLLWASMAWSLLPFIWAWLDAERQFLHDRLAGTRLVMVSKK